MSNFGTRIHRSAKWSGSCNNEIEMNDIESEIDDESHDNSKQCEASDADLEEEDY